MLQVTPVGVLKDHVIGLLLAAQTDELRDVLVIHLVQQIDVPFEFVQHVLVLRVAQRFHHHYCLLGSRRRRLCCFLGVFRRRLVLGGEDSTEFTAAEWFEFLQMGPIDGELVVAGLGFFRVIAGLAVSGVGAVALARLAVLSSLAARAVGLDVGLAELALLLLNFAVFSFFWSALLVYSFFFYTAFGNENFVT